MYTYIQIEEADGRNYKILVSSGIYQCAFFFFYSHCKTARVNVFVLQQLKDSNYKILVSSGIYQCVKKKQKKSHKAKPKI
jgi:hypothetical protein